MVKSMYEVGINGKNELFMGEWFELAHELYLRGIKPDYIRRVQNE